MIEEYRSIRNEVANHRFDKVDADKFDKLLNVIGTEHVPDGTRVTAEELIDGERVTETFLFPQDSDIADVVRPSSLCFSSTGNGRRDSMFKAYVSGYYEGNRSPTVDGYELHEGMKTNQ